MEIIFQQASSTACNRRLGIAGALPHHSQLKTYAFCDACHPTGGKLARRAAFCMPGPEYAVDNCYLA
jgi:hypothetical protein